MKLLKILENSKFIGSFGVPYLDEKVTGILPNDLILVGARSGAGKSSLAQMIAAHNSRLGNKVSLISLENFENDDFITKAYYSYVKQTRNYNLTVREFMGGLGTSFNPDMQALERAEQEAEKFFENIVLTTRKKGFDLEELKKTMVKNVVEDGCKIIILDHIDYIDKIDPKENDIIHITEIMRTIRELQDAENVAVIAMSHLRKPFTGKTAIKVPGVDEFIGSSNKVKESTMVIVFAPDDTTNETTMKKQKATYCCIRKLRHGGYDNTCARLWFDVRTGRYLDEYDKCIVNYSGTEVTDDGRL